MSLLPLLGALLPWAVSPADALFRTLFAVSLLSIEMQLVTVSGAGSLQTIALVNAIVTIAAAGWQLARRRPDLSWMSSLTRVAPWPAVLSLGAVVLVLNLVLPLEAADPYNLQRVEQIERLGTLAYAPDADPKVNIVGFLYELVLADVRALPAIGPVLVRLHGVFGLFFYLLGLAAIRDWLRADASRWPWIALLVVPVVFHQFVLVKNDLFLAVPAAVALVWLISRARAGSWRETAGVAWLIGMVAGYKLTNLPLALILAAGVLAAQRHQPWRSLGALTLGGIGGALAGGLFFALFENWRWYGDPFAREQVAAMGNVTTGIGAAVESVARFGVSLVDLGLLTRRWWPGRGGWGGTFGLPFIWAAGVLLVSCRREPQARYALGIAAAHFLVFAATFPDADVAHRLALAPALVVIAIAVRIVERDAGLVAYARLLLAPVLILSAVQILRSAMLYLIR
jgi:hypothetical protein